MDFRSRLLKIIKTKKLSQAKFAEKIGVSAGNVSNWLNPVYNSKPTFDAMLQICERFEVNLNWLLTGDGDMFLGGCCSKEDKEDIRGQLKEAEIELLRLREQNASLKIKNEELNGEIAERLREIVGLQRKLIPNT
ncbi:MAG: helix-turn-helix transcriptional regulator [Candidatus Cloacimonetes bacterium]|nr:helix-turn-helix transcriptional regulator [Candidatus Cloacimonadota bacterium]